MTELTREDIERIEDEARAIFDISDPDEFDVEIHRETIGLCTLALEALDQGEQGDTISVKKSSLLKVVRKIDFDAHDVSTNDFAHAFDDMVLAFTPDEISCGLSTARTKEPSDDR